MCLAQGLNTTLSVGVGPHKIRTDADEQLRFSTRPIHVSLYICIYVLCHKLYCAYMQLYLIYIAESECSGESVHMRGLGRTCAFAYK